MSRSISIIKLQLESYTSILMWHVCPVGSLDCCVKNSMRYFARSLEIITRSKADSVENRPNVSPKMVVARDLPHMSDDEVLFFLGFTIMEISVSGTSYRRNHIRGGKV